MGRQPWACDHLIPWMEIKGDWIELHRSLRTGVKRVREDVVEFFVSSLREGMLHPPYRPPSSFPLCLSIPTLSCTDAQITAQILDCLRILESTACFDLRSSTTLPLLGNPLVLLRSVWPGMWEGGAAPLTEEESVC